MMMNCGMVDQWKAFSLFSSWDNCQRSSPLRISDTPQAGFEPAQSLSSGLVEWSCTVVITTTPQHHYMAEVEFHRYEHRNEKNRQKWDRKRLFQDDEQFCIWKDYWECKESQRPETRDKWQKEETCWHQSLTTIQQNTWKN